MGTVNGERHCAYTLMASRTCAQRRTKVQGVVGGGTKLRTPLRKAQNKLSAMPINRLCNMTAQTNRTAI